MNFFFRLNINQTLKSLKIWKFKFPMKNEIFGYFYVKLNYIVFTWKYLII